MSKRVFQENKARQIFRKTIISCVCVSERKKCSFFEKFGVFRFPETPVLRFALLSYYRRVDARKNCRNARINQSKMSPSSWLIIVRSL